APSVLVEAVQAVARGKKYVSADIADGLTRRHIAASSDTANGLSAREFEVLRFLIQGKRLQEIGEAMGLHPKTIANHQSAIKQKLGAETAVQLARIGSELLQGPAGKKRS